MTKYRCFHRRDLIRVEKITSVIELKQKLKEQDIEEYIEDFQEGRDTWIVWDKHDVWFVSDAEFEDLFTIMGKIKNEN